MVQRYNLHGPQVEPEAAHWTYSGYRIRVIDIHAKHPTKPDVPPFNDDPAFLEQELQELIYLGNHRADPTKIAGDFPEGSGNRRRRPLSKFFSMHPPPITAQFNTHHWTVPPQPAQPDGSIRPIKNILQPCTLGDPWIRSGQELARMFEGETPGLLHRHALHCLLYERFVSPPRQARIGLALEVAIYSAMLAAWHIKWGHKKGNKPDYTRTYVARPIEYERETQGAGSERFDVLYDYKLNSDGREGGDRRCPGDDDDFLSPGTPRHPAYPAGHSTYAAAASRILEHFFGKEGSLKLSDDELEEAGDDEPAIHLRRLADNIGVARLWAGVHWRQDHTTGRMLGNWVADQVIRDLCRDQVKPLGKPPNPCNAGIPPKPFDEVEAFKKYRDDLAEKKTCEKGQDTIPPPPAEFSVQDFQSQRGGTQ